MSVNLERKTVFSTVFSTSHEWTPLISEHLKTVPVDSQDPERYSISFTAHILGKSLTMNKSIIFETLITRLLFVSNISSFSCFFL